jgi:hypothetical protein
MPSEPTGRLEGPPQEALHDGCDEGAMDLNQIAAKVVGAASGH